MSFYQLDDPSIASILFSGKVVLGGDLRQILQLIEGGTLAHIIDAIIMNSPLWHSLKVLNLTINMQITNSLAQVGQENDGSEFCRWILDLVNGTLPTTTHEDQTDGTWIDIPEDLLIQSNGDKI